MIMIIFRVKSVTRLRRGHGHRDQRSGPDTESSRPEARRGSAGTSRLVDITAGTLKINLPMN